MLTRTPCRPLTCCFRHPVALAGLVRAARPSARRPWSPREASMSARSTELITGYRNGVPAAFLAAVHGVSLSSLLHSRCSLDAIRSRIHEKPHRPQHSPLRLVLHRMHSGMCGCCWQRSRGACSVSPSQRLRSLARKPAHPLSPRSRIPHEF